MPVVPVAPYDTRFSEEWERCQPYLLPAIETLHGTHTIDDVRLGVENGMMFFWPMPNSAAVTIFNKYPRLTSCYVFLGGGRMDEILAWQPLVEAWASLHGCSRIESTGRNWSRSFKGQVASVHVFRELDNGRRG